MKTTRIDFKLSPNVNCHTKCNKSKRAEITDEDMCNEITSVVDGMPIRCVGDWAMDKIFHLIQYFGIFTMGMKGKWQGKINYIEICSGVGRCVNRYSGDEFNGSSICIIEHNGCKYLNKAIFFDYNEKVVDTLNKRINQRNVMNAKAYIGDYNNPIALCDQIIKETNGIGLNLVFIDPTDCSVPFTLLKNLKRKLTYVDFIVNFAIRTDFNRNIRKAIINPDNHQAVLNKYKTFLGSDDFFNNPKVIEFAQQGNQMELRKLFREAYIKSLKGIGYNHFDFKPIENYYDLVFATSHPKGIEFWKKANDIPFTGQLTLFN
jgi:three-Cys-motif partner protein